MPTAKTLSVLAVIAGLAITAFVVYAFYEALRTKPQRARTGRIESGLAQPPRAAEANVNFF